MPKMLLFEYKTGQRLPQRPQILASPIYVQHHGIASSRDNFSREQLNTFFDSDDLRMHPIKMWDLNDSREFYENQHTARTCRLVCRDWAKQLPFGDPKLRVANGVVWHYVGDVWQILPRSHRAWVLRDVEWWMEPSQQCKVWYPKVSVIGLSISPY